MISVERLETLEALFISWSGQETAPPNFERLANIANGLFYSQLPNLGDYEDYSEECKNILDKALIEQVLYYIENGTDLSTKQWVTAIKAGDASENYSTPNGNLNTICDSASNLLDTGSCGFKSRVTIGVTNGCYTGCDCNV